MPNPIIDRDAIIEKALIASGSEMTVGGIVRVAIKTAADDLLAPIEAMHYPAYNDTHRTPLCDQCHGKAGVHECGCWADADVQPVCGACWQGYKYVPVEWPCPTAQAVAAIREAVRA